MKRIVIVLMLCASAAWAAGGHGDEEAAGAEGAVFKEGQGITLGAETREAIGLTLVDVDEGALATEVRLTAQVYRTAGEASQNTGERRGCAYASAVLTGDAADALDVDMPVEIAGLAVTGRVHAVERTMLEVSGQAEVLIEIPDPDARLAIGAFIEARTVGGSPTTVVRVPISAVLESANGTFAFVLNGKALMRTAITTGARDANHVEIVEGLYAGDAVAATAVETLYLIELRATKGGGHCH